MDRQPYLSIRDVSKQYTPSSNTLAVSHLNLEIYQSEFIAILGPSGCGKTTTLRMLAGLESVSSGAIFINDKPIHRLPPSQRHIGLAFETYALYPPLSVYDNIGYNLKANHVKPEDIKRRVTAIAQRLGIQGFLSEKPGHLSGGQKQRVNLARALVRAPELLLLDEPLSHLDTQERRKLRQELKFIHQDTHLTSILVTHDQSEAMALADRIAILRDGTLQQFGQTSEIYRFPANRFVAEFIGEPSINFLPARMSPTGIAVNGLVHWTCNSSIAPDTDVMIGIRPSDIAVHAHGANSPPSGTFELEVTVNIVEYLGDEVHVTVGFPSGGTLMFVTEPGSQFVANQHLTLSVVRFHVFASETGKRLLTIESQEENTTMLSAEGVIT